ncbi:MAG TPA: phage portal protein [Solirubrobacterales bacterium]|nr:phage portal protein [Solirubrobacterales bacterium]HNB58673.1 phage portal protein [Phycisphaerales bacterium]
MSILARLLERRANPTFTLATPGDYGLSVLGALPGVAGKSVTAETARTIPAFFAGVRAIAEDLAALPLPLFRRKDDGSRERVRNHPAYELLNTVRPNPYQSPMELRELLIGWMTCRGNGYAYIESDNRGTVTGLYPLHPCRVTVLVTDDDRIWYQYTANDGSPATYASSEVLHLKAFSDNGYLGISAVENFRNSLSISLASDEFAGKFFANGSAPGGILKHPGKLTADASAKLRASWEARQAGSANAFKTAILEEGMTWEAMAFNQKDAQFLESRQFQIEEIARMLRMPPHKLQSLLRSTNNNIEHQGIEYVVDTIRPRAVRIEQALGLALLTDKERKAGLYLEHNVDGLLRGDSISRAQSMSIRVAGGMLAVNEARELDNLPPVEGGEKPRVPMNTQPIDQPTPDPTPKDQGAPPVPAGSGTPNDGGRRALRRASGMALGDAVARIRRRQQSSEKGGEQYARNALLPALEAYAVGLGELQGGKVPHSEPALLALVTRALDPTDGDVVEAGLTLIETLWQRG